MLYEPLFALLDRILVVGSWRIAAKLDDGIRASLEPGVNIFNIHMYTLQRLLSETGGVKLIDNRPP